MLLSHLRPTLVLLGVMTLLLGIAYPLAITSVAQLAFPHQANGSLILRNGQVVGSELIGQGFTGGEWFHPRPSATTDTDPADASKTVAAPYNAAGSAGSNLGPTSAALVARVRDAVAEAGGGPVPADLVTTSASGLDPHISPAAALFQVPRVARARNMPEADLRALVAAQVEDRVGGILGEPRVNVLRLNLALEAMPRRHD